MPPVLVANWPQPKVLRSRARQAPQERLPACLQVGSRSLCLFCNAGVALLHSRRGFARPFWSSLGVKLSLVWLTWTDFHRFLNHFFIKKMQFVVPFRTCDFVVHCFFFFFHFPSLFNYFQILSRFSYQTTMDFQLCCCIPFKKLMFSVFFHVFSEVLHL